MVLCDDEKIFITLQLTCRVQGVNVKPEWYVENILKLLHYSTDPLLSIIKFEGQYSLFFSKKNIVNN